MFEELIEPMRKWISSNDSPFPVRNDDIIVKDYGERVLNDLRTIEKVFYKTDADKVILDFDIERIREKTKSDFLKEFPDACEEIIKMLQGCYIYDFYWR